MEQWIRTIKIILSKWLETSSVQLSRNYKTGHRTLNAM